MVSHVLQVILYRSLGKYTWMLGFFVCFCYLILRGDPLSQRLLFRGPTESLQVHTHTYSYTQHNYKQSQTIKFFYYYTYTRTLCGQWQDFFFKSFRGAGLGLNPEHPITLAQHHTETVTEPPLHPMVSIL